MQDSTQYLTLSEAASRLGAGGKRPSTITIWRWCRKGCKGVRLEYARFGREIRVTPEALARFGQELAAADKPLSAPATPAAAQTRPRSEDRRRRDIEAAKRRLADAGIEVAQ